MLSNKFLAVSGASEPTDAQFNYVTMLLHGDGTNGAQNNTFLDSSTNNFTITRNGNTTQGSFSPYGSNWANYFPSGAYMTTTSGQDFGTGNFTIEFWVYLPEWVDSDYNAAPFGGESSGVGIMGGIASTGAMAVGVTATSWNVTTSAGSVPLNTWTHIAVVRQGTGSNQTKIYINGAVAGTGTFSTNCTDTTFDINRRQGTQVGYSAYFSNVRIVKNAVYTGAFTPSTTPLTAISGTSLLTCQANRFIDSSGNNYTLNRSGSLSVQRFNPFGTSTAYSTATIGGSGYFDGSGDSLTTPSSAAFAFGTGDFTVEAWVYITADSSAIRGFWQNGASDSCNLQRNTSGNLQAWDGADRISTTSVPSNAWAHVAFTRASGTARIFVNGTQALSWTSSVNYSASSTWVAGYTAGGTNTMTGYISDLRILKGTALYTGSYTPPTAPLTAITNTSLLTNMTNSGIVDNAMMNDLETVGNAQISTSVVKYGNGSMYFDGTGDYLTVPVSSKLMDFGTGDFTVEMWCNFSAVGTHDILIMYAGAVAKFYFYYYGGTLQIGYYDANTGYQQTPDYSFTNNQWYHMAWCRSNGVLRIFVNGVHQPYGDGAYASSMTGITKIEIGAASSRASTACYLDDVRITKGYARYTANFTPPTASLADKGPI